MQFSAQYTRVAEFIEDTTNARWSLALIKQYLNDAALDFARQTKCYKRLSSALTASATTPTSAWYTLPTDFFELESVNNDGEWLRAASLGELPNTWDAETGTPYAYLRIGDLSTTEMRVYPYTTAALTALKVQYAALPPTMTQTTDLPTGVPAAYHVALVYFAVAKCYQRDFEEGDPAKAAMFEAMYREQVADCKARLARHMSGAAVNVPYRHL